MSVENVKNYLKKYGRENDVMEFDTSSATVELAAKAIGVSPAEITKTLAFKSDTGCVLIAMAGDAKVDNRKFKDYFGKKAKMLTPEETLSLTGHAVGGVCQFALPDSSECFCDVSLKRFDYVYPACGSSNSAIKLTCDQLFSYSQSKAWIDVCKDWE